MISKCSFQQRKSKTVTTHSIVSSPFRLLSKSSIIPVRYYLCCELSTLASTLIASLVSTTWPLTLRCCSRSASTSAASPKVRSARRSPVSLSSGHPRRALRSNARQVVSASTHDPLEINNQRVSGWLSRQAEERHPFRHE